MTQNSPLGRGLSTLLGEDVSRETIKNLPLNQIKANKNQPRKIFDDAPLQELVASIKIKGIIQPIIVRKLSDNNYECVAGERRMRAAQIAGYHEIPAIIKQLNDTETLELGLLENIHRQDLNALEEAEALERLMREFDHTQESLANLIGRSRSSLANNLRLLTLPASVQELIHQGKISASHARNLVGRSGAEALALKIVNENLSVREVESLTRQPEKIPKIHKAKNPHLNDMNDLARELSQKLGVKCQITWRNDRGKISLYIDDLANFDDIIAKLKK